MVDNTQNQDKEKTYNESSGNSLSYLKGSLSVLTDTAIKMSELADEGPSKVLVGLGATITLFAISIKVELFGVKLSSINTTEFAFLLITGWLFLGAASLMKFLQYRDQYNMKKLVWEAGQRQMEAIQEHQQNNVEDSQKKNKKVLDEEKVKV